MFTSLDTVCFSFGILRQISTCIEEHCHTTKTGFQLFSGFVFHRNQKQWISPHFDLIQQILEYCKPSTATMPFLSFRRMNVFLGPFGKPSCYGVHPNKALSEQQPTQSFVLLLPLRQFSVHTSQNSCPPYCALSPPSTLF